MNIWFARNPNFFVYMLVSAVLLVKKDILSSYDVVYVPLCGAVVQQ